MKSVRRAALVRIFGAILLTVGLVACEQSRRSPDPDLSVGLREAVTAEGVTEHAARLATIARVNGGNRAAGTPGYDASANYVADRLREAGYEVTVQGFEFPAYAAVRRA